MAAMATLSDLVTTGGLRPMGVAATVSVAPSSADDTLDVFHTTDAGERADEQGLRWASRGGALPAVGDDALLFLDSLGDPWAVVWPSGGSPDTSGSLAALDARLNVLEAISTPHLLSGSLKVSELRTIASHSMTVGVSVAAVSASGLTVLQGIAVASLDPSAHHTFSWYPNVPNARITFNNSGAAQTVAITYRVTGT